MNRIAELRKEKHLNQVGLAMKLNGSQYMISSYETGRHQPPMDMLIQLSDFFGVSIDYIVGKSNIRQSADSFTGNNLTEKELKLLDLFRKLSNDKQEQAIGIIWGIMNV